MKLEDIGFYSRLAHNVWREMDDIDRKHYPSIDKLLVDVRRILRKPRVLTTIKFREYNGKLRKTEKEQQNIPAFC